MSEIAIHCKYDELVEPKKLLDHPKNRNKHGGDQIERLAKMYAYHGIRHPIIVSNLSGHIVAGHGRKLAAIRAGVKEMPVVFQDFESTEAEYAFLQADNAIALWADLDLAAINEDLPELGPDFDLDMLGIKNFVLDPSELPPANPTLAERFLVPPFSVLDARQGYWKERKETWLAMGIESEMGRGENVLDMSASMAGITDPEERARWNEQRRVGSLTYAKGRDRNDAEMDDVSRKILNQGGTSIFDPVLCELIYRWFCPQSGTVLDPFAGGSVRGVVASKLGLHYRGCELRPEQVEANREQADYICTRPKPEWACGDSIEIRKHIPDVTADLMFSCPPYADLEVYSDDPRDISNMSYDDFLMAYRTIIGESLGMLANDRFACFVVGEVRDKKKGMYRNFVMDTIRAFEDAGARYYNEMILVTSVGSLALRAGKQFSASRKVGKTHQNVLVFVKGDPKKATAACGPVEIGSLDEESDA